MDGMRLALELAMACLGFMMVRFMSQIDESIQRLTESNETLNQRLAVIFEKVDNHEKRLDKLEDVKPS